MGGCPSGVGGRPSRGVECSVPGTHGCQAHLFRTTRLLMKLAPKREAGWLGFFRGGEFDTKNAGGYRGENGRGDGVVTPTDFCNKIISVPPS